MTFMLGLNDLVKALVNSLVVIVLEVLAQDVAQLFFGGEDQVSLSSGSGTTV
jgi:hypothetical protein